MIFGYPLGAISGYTLGVKRTPQPNPSSDCDLDKKAGQELRKKLQVYADLPGGLNQERASLFGTKKYEKWDVHLRCISCGSGVTKGREVQVLGRTVCWCCGAPDSRLVKWVGKRVVNTYLGRDLVFHEWVEFEHLPSEILAQLPPLGADVLLESAIEALVKRRLGAEFDSRVRAALEVERSLDSGMDKRYPERKEVPCPETT